MITPSLFGIAITDRMSRLIAADAAEERAQSHLANRLRDTSRPLVLERGEPHPSLLPAETTWTTQRQPGLRRANALLKRCAGNPLSGQLVLRLVYAEDGQCYPESAHPDGIGWNDSTWFVRPVGSDDRIAGAPDDCVVRKGVAILQIDSHPDAIPVLHIAPDDALRFGLIFVPGFPMEGTAP